MEGSTGPDIPKSLKELDGQLNFVRREAESMRKLLESFRPQLEKLLAEIRKRGMEQAEVKQHIQDLHNKVSPLRRRVSYLESDFAAVEQKNRMIENLCFQYEITPRNLQRIRIKYAKVKTEVESVIEGWNSFMARFSAADIPNEQLPIDARRTPAHLRPRRQQAGIRETVLQKILNRVRHPFGDRPKGPNQPNGGIHL